MATFPSYAIIRRDSFSEDPQPSVLRTEMERGAPQQSLVNSQDLVLLNVSIVFESLADAAAFKAWHKNTIGKVGHFDLVHPISGATVDAWFREGYIGKLQPFGVGMYSRDCVIEYLE